MTLLTKLGLNGATIPRADLQTGIIATKDAGFSYYEPRIPLLKKTREFGKRTITINQLQKSGLSWLPLNALEGVFELNREDLTERARRAFSLAREFGVSQMILVPGRDSQTGGSMDMAAEVVSRLVQQGNEYGVSVLYELIGFAVHAYSTLHEAYKISRLTEVPLVLDTFHLATSQTQIGEIEQLDPKCIGLVHLSDAIVEDGRLNSILDKDRVLSGEGDLELGEIMAAINRTGYDGPVSVEVFHPKYGAEDPFEVARRAYHSASQLLEESG